MSKTAKVRKYYFRSRIHWEWIVITPKNSCRTVIPVVKFVLESEHVSKNRSLYTIIFQFQHVLLNSIKLNVSYIKLLDCYEINVQKIRNLCGE